MSALTRRALAAGAAPLLAVAFTPGLFLPAAAADQPDAELIRLCAEHVVNLDAYNTATGAALNVEGPLWQAYCRTQDAISAAQPVTLAGVVAKARAAAAEARQPDGSEPEFTCMAGQWGWDLVNDLLRLLPAGELGA